MGLMYFVERQGCYWEINVLNKATHDQQIWEKES